MKKHILTAVLLSLSLTVPLYGCTDNKNGKDKSEAQPTTVTLQREKAQYSDGNYSVTGLSLYADPKIWKYSETDSASETECDLIMITDREFTTCAVDVYVSDDRKKGETAQDKAMSGSENILTTGTLATASRTFYYCEWALNDETNARLYTADFGDDKYLCLYAESTNFGYVEGKIADLLSDIKTKE